MELGCKTLLQDDSGLGASVKSISFSSTLSIKTPTVGLRGITPEGEKLDRINELTKPIEEKTLKSLDEDDGFSSDMKSKIKSKFHKNKVNLVHFYLKTDTFPEERLSATLGTNLHACSENAIILPSVKKGLFLENKKLSDNRISQYLTFQDIVMEAINGKNGKIVLGIIPLLPPKFSRLIIDHYFENQILNQTIKGFVLDAGTANLLNHEADFLAILNRIKHHEQSLDEVFIHGVNLGVDRFVKNEIRADDFLGLFAHVDSLGITYKVRFGKKAEDKDKPKSDILSIVLPPRKKIFSRQHYSHVSITELPNDSKVDDVAKTDLERIKDVSQYSRISQLHEAHKIQGMIGKEKLLEYVAKKPAVNDISLNRLTKLSKI